MDLRSFYKKIDVDNIKSKLPPIPQIKIPKIKSRKIFKSSREDLSSQQQATAGAFAGPPMTPQFLPPPSAFIDRTPTRISTVSSLMNINEGYASKNYNTMPTYRAASTFEVEHYPDGVENGDTTSGSATSKFSDKFKKTYKDISEFKIKDFFGKKTVVKRTEIEVNVYARQYERERREEEALEGEQETESNYQFQIKEARRNLSKSSDSISPPDSLASGVPSPIRSELSHLQRSITPPLLARRRNAIDEPGPSRIQLQRSMSEDSAHGPPSKPNRSSLWGIAENNSSDELPTSQLMSYKAGISKLSGFRKSRKENPAPVPAAAAVSDQPSTSERAWKLKSLRARFASEDFGSEQKPKKNIQSHESLDDQSESEKMGKSEKKGWKMSNLSLKHSDPSESHTSSPEGKFNTIKQSIKRLKQRRSRARASEESEPEQNEEVAKPNVSDQLRAGLRRLRLKDRSFTFDEGETKESQTPTGSTSTSQTATQRLRSWKKSFKMNRPSEAAVNEEGATESRPPPPPPGRSATLLRKLNQIRSRKAESDNGTDDESTEQKHTTDSQQKTKTTNIERIGHARDKAMKKVNEQMQKMKKLHASKSRDSPVESSPEKPPRSRRIEIEDRDEVGVIAELPKSAPTIWATSRAISQSFESDNELPRVLIHQDNSDQYESTLIIAVTRPAPAVPRTIINEIIPKTSRPGSEWIPNKKAISSFLETTPSPPSTSKQVGISRGHVRKHSIDSNDSDSWIPENYRNKSCSSSTSAGLNMISETCEPWKVRGAGRNEKLYKTKSIDIFSNQDKSAFADFDDEMKNVPVRRIASVSAESIEHNTDDDDDKDKDDASMITRLKRTSPLAKSRLSLDAIQGSTDSHPEVDLPPKKGQIGNSQESLDANYDENETYSSDDDDMPPTMTPSPPPSYSPPPPPLPLRKPPRHITDRNESMVRLAKPLVKQASLRRHYSEDIEPSDLGKVNKLISRFEKNLSEENLSIDEITPPPENERDKQVVEERRPPTRTKEDNNRNGSKKRAAPLPNKFEDIPATIEKTSNTINNNDHELHAQLSKDTSTLEILDNISIQSPNSEYGSPIGSICLSERTISEYGSPIGVAFPTKPIDQFHTARRLSNRSSLRDDETYYSFESDEENNFYSLGDSSSSKYTIEI